MKFLFIRKDGAFTGEVKDSPSNAPTERLTLLRKYEIVGFVGHQYYWNSEVGRVAKEKDNSKSEFKFISWYIVYRGFLCYAYHQLAGTPNRLLDCDKSTLEGFIQKMECALSDPEAFTKKCLEEIEEQKNQEAKRREEIAQKNKEKEEAEQNRYEKAVESYIKGKDPLSWHDFEKLCKEKGIKIHIRTIGAGRKRIKEISKKGRITLYGEVAKSLFNSIWLIQDELHKKL